MRILNKTNEDLEFQLGKKKFGVVSRAMSRIFAPTVAFLNNLVNSYTPDEILVVVGGDFEKGICNGINGLSPYLTYSIDEAVSQLQKELKKAKEEKSSEVTSFQSSLVEELQQPLENSETTEDSEKKKNKRSTKKTEMPGDNNQENLNNYENL